MSFTLFNYAKIFPIFPFDLKQKYQMYDLTIINAWI